MRISAPISRARGRSGFHECELYSHWHDAWRFAGFLYDAEQMQFHMFRDTFFAAIQIYLILTLSPLRSIRFSTISS
jgi:hypothetical protein